MRRTTLLTKLLMLSGCVKGACSEIYMSCISADVMSGTVGSATGSRNSLRDYRYPVISPLHDLTPNTTILECMKAHVLSTWAMEATKANYTAMVGHTNFMSVWLNSVTCSEITCFSGHIAKAAAGDAITLIHIIKRLWHAGKAGQEKFSQVVLKWMEIFKMTLIDTDWTTLTVVFKTSNVILKHFGASVQKILGGKCTTETTSRSNEYYP